MSSFLKKVASLFEKKPDPAELAMQRRVKLNALQSRFSLEVKKQDRYLREYFAQAVEAKRTGDEATLAAIKKLLSFTQVTRRRAQRMLHTTRFLATMSDQMDGYKDFCGVLSEVSESMEHTISSAEVIQTQQRFQRTLQGAQSMDQFVDQMLGAFDSAVGEMADSEAETSGIKPGAIDDMIAKLAGEKDNATEQHLEELLAKF